MQYQLPAKGQMPKSSIPGFQFVSPGGGEIFEVGSNISIVWTGGPVGVQSVALYLIDITQWQVVLLLGTPAYQSTSPFGVFRATIPVNFTMNHSHPYQIYIQDSAVTTWTYGPQFSLT